jgi:adenosine deaminase
MRDWLAALPKVELHLHLEGAIPLPALWQLIEKYGGDPEVRSPAQLRQRLRYRDFPDFIEAWIWKNGYLRAYDDFSLIAEALARNLVLQNIRYAEVFFSPARFTPQGLKTEGLAKAIRAGLQNVPDVEVSLIADLVRDFGPDQAMETLQEIELVREQGIVGIGIGGSEQLHPPAPFAMVYRAARAMGFHTTAHAGEAAGADSVRSAVEHLHVERIGHGIRAVEDESVLELLAERQIPLEVCPLSNVATGVVADIEQHPVRELWDTGVRLTINTDDPGMFHNTLTEELLTLVEVFGFNSDEIRRLQLNALEAAWMPETERTALIEDFTTTASWYEVAPHQH